MTNTIFDLIPDELSEGKKGFMQLADNAPEVKDDSFYKKIQDYGKTALKGIVEGFGRAGKAMSGSFELPRFEKEKFIPGRSSQEELEGLTETLDKILPTEEDFGQKALRRGLKEVPLAMSQPFSTLGNLPRSLLSGFFGESAKELGLPEWAQTAAEMTAFLTPDVTKKLLSSGKNKDIIEAGKRFGLSEEQITPLIQSDFKKKWLTKLSPKRGSTQKALGSTKSQLDKAYENIQDIPLAKVEISEKANGKLINDLFNSMSKLPRKIQNVINPDLEDLLNNKITGNSLMNFYRDVNSNLGNKNRYLKILKEPIKTAIKSTSPELAKDFDMINNLYTKYYPMAQKLKPSLASDLISSAETIGLLSSLAIGYYPTLLHFAGEKTARKISQQMLINPRFQQLSKKMINAMNENKYSVVKKLTEAFSNQIRPISSEVADQLSEITDEDIFELLNNHQPGKGQQKK